MRAVHAAVAVALLLRLAFGLGYWTGKPLTHDEREYLTLAVNVAQGRGFATELPGDAPSPASNIQRFDRGPGYPLFLAPLTWLDADLRAGRLPADVPAAVKIVQAILGAAAILVLAAWCGASPAIAPAPPPPGSPRCSRRWSGCRPTP